MYEFIRKNLDKKKFVTLFGIIITLLILIAVSYKSDAQKIKKTNIVKIINKNSDIVNFKKFLLNQIKSPYLNINYEISPGDTIQKILKKYKVKNNDIQTVINQYQNTANLINFWWEIKLTLLLKKINLLTVTQ